MEARTSDIEQEISDSTDGAPANEARTPGQELGMWVSDIENLLDRQFPVPVPVPVPVQVPYRALPISIKKYDSDGSICPNDRFPVKFKIGALVYEYPRGNITFREDPMWKYVAYMSRWLGFNISSFLEDMKKMEAEARRYYQETNEWHLISDSDRFLESLMVGGCFLSFAILFFQEDHSFRKTESNSVDGKRSSQYGILEGELRNSLTQIKLDMLNYGNQIPWFVVVAVFENSSSRLGNPCIQIDEIPMSCFDDLYPRANKYQIREDYHDFRHLLHIFHWTRTREYDYDMQRGISWEWDSPTIRFCGIRLLKRWRKTNNLPTWMWLGTKSFSMFYIPSATELLGSATTFGQLDSRACACEVKYSNNEVSALMEIAPLYIFPYSDKIFRDLVRFEQRCDFEDCGLRVTAYIACMQNLLKTKEDVKLLQKNGIVRSSLSDEDVLGFFHDFRNFLLSDQNAVVPVTLIDLSEKVNRHHDNGRGRQYAEFKSYFCPNRWVVISVLGGISLFVLTAIQTIYTVLGYQKA